MRLSQYRLILLGLIAFIAIVFNTSYALLNTLDIGTGSSPALALNRNRMPVIVYSSGLLWLATCTDLACPSASITSISGTNSSALPSIVLTADEQPIISYYNTATRDLMLVVCNDTTCSVPTVTIVDSVGDVGQYSSIQLSRSGTPIISYYDATNGNLKLAFCNNLSCTSQTFQNVDLARDVGQFTSLRLNSGDRPVISYYNVTNRRLQLAICNNELCTNRTITIVDRNGRTGQYTSLSLNSSGWPVISYYDETHRDLKLAICNDTSCTRPTLRTVDSSGMVGQYTSLALDTNDKPIITYFVASQNTSRLTVCGDITCNNKRRFNLSGASAGETSVELRNPQGVYAAFVNNLGEIAIYADIPTPTGCYIDAPSTVDEGTTFRVAVRCDELTAQVYGFEIGLHAEGNITPRTAAYNPGSFVIEADSNILEGPNQLTDYAVSRRTPAATVTGSFSLGNVDFDAGLVQTDTMISLTLDRLLLGDIQGGMLTVPIIANTLVRVKNVAIP